MNTELVGQGVQVAPANTANNASISNIAPNPKVETNITSSVNEKVLTKENVDQETQMALDKATGLMQNITSDKITGKVIRKMPTDEYLHLLKLLDTITTGSVNKNI